MIISGGGTGGHIFPAVSIAGKMMELNPENEILFVGAEGKMEMEKVPAAGFKIIGLPITGLQRQLTLKNIIGDLAVPFKVIASVRKARKIIREFKPDIAIGVGGYASAPLLWAATGMGIPSLIQEQNGFAGLTNKLLGKRVGSICVAYEGMERFFPSDKIIMTGNPVRQQLLECKLTKDEAVRTFGLEPGKKTILIVGGSLGARTVNESVLQHLADIRQSGVQVIWQTGKYYYGEMLKQLNNHEDMPMLKTTDFIADMGAAYKAADLVISRAGASSISELCLLGKPSILVPSPNVAEDHQTHNAMALVNKEAALMVKDADAREQLLPLAIKTALTPATLSQLSSNAKAMGLPDSARIIAEEVLKLVRS